MSNENNEQTDVDLLSAIIFVLMERHTNERVFISQDEIDNLGINISGARSLMIEQNNRNYRITTIKGKNNTSESIPDIKKH